MPTPPRDPVLGRRAWVVLLLLAVSILIAVLFGDQLSFSALADNRDRLLLARNTHPVLAVVLFLVLYVAIVTFSIPGATVISLTGGYLFGTFPGVAYNIIGATTGAALLFLAVRWGLGERLSARIDASDGKVRQIKQGLDDNQWAMLFLIRLVPTVPFFVANLIPAVLNVRFSRFLISTALGILPGALVLTSIGAGLPEVFAAGLDAPDLSVLRSPQVVLPLIGLCLLILLPVAWRRLGKVPEGAGKS